MQAKILDFGFERLGDKAEPFAQFVNAQAERWAVAVKAVGIEPRYFTGVDVSLVAV